MTVFYHDIQEAQDALGMAQRAYLKRWGWKETCQTPGSYWLWRRDFTPDDEAAVARWHEREAQRTAEIAEVGHACTPNGRKPPSAYGIVTVPLELAISMTLSVLDDRPEMEEDASDA